MKTVIKILAVATLSVIPAGAQLPWNLLDGLAAKAKESVEINLDSSSLQLANGLIGGKNNDQASKVLSQLKGITVRSYEFENSGQYDLNILRAFRDQLVAQGWSKIVDVKDSNETFELYSKRVNGQSAGFAMIAAEPKELAVIYIDGPLDLADLAGLGGQLGIPRLPGVQVK
jgi:hypothetical protein